MAAEEGEARGEEGEVAAASAPEGIDFSKKHPLEHTWRVGSPLRLADASRPARWLRRARFGAGAAR
jgi:hypothetical protein